MNRFPTSANLLDSTLRLMTFAASDSEIDRLADWVLSSPITVQMAPERQQELISKLHGIHASTLGNILQTAIQQQHTDAEQLSTQTRLPLSMINNLVDDTLFISNVPVVLFRNLLQRLQIPFDAAKASILQTIGHLKMEMPSEADMPTGALAFRRDHNEGKVGESRQEGRSLFENEEALTMYLDRLEELMAPK